MRVLLLFPNYKENFSFTPVSSHPSLGLAMIASVLRESGHQVHVVDATASKLNIHRLTRRVAGIRPDIIGITANISFGRKAVLTGRWLKREFPGVPVIFGGPWPTTEHEHVLRSGAADYVVLGEGEETIVELVSYLEGGQPSLEKIRGIAYLDENDEIIVTDKRPLIQDLDALPFPAWDLFPDPKHYIVGTDSRRYYPIMTSRGCIYNCANCTKLIHGYKIRKRSVQNVISEIQYLKDRFKAEEIIIIDDAFNQDISRAEEILDEIVSRNIKIKIHCSNGLRADKITPRLAWKLRRAGTYDVSLGIESGNQDIVNALGKQLDLRKVKRAVRILKKVGILTTGYFIVGLPGESIHTMVDTKRFIMDLDIDVIGVFKPIPFPGTRLHEIVSNNGFFLDSFGRTMQFYSTREPVFEMAGLPKELVMHAIQDIYQSFYFRFSKLLYFLKKINPRNWRWYLSAFILVLGRIFSAPGNRGGRDREQFIAHLKERLKELEELDAKRKSFMDPALPGN